MDNIAYQSADADRDQLNDINTSTLLSLIDEPEDLSELDVEDLMRHLDFSEQMRHGLW